MKIDFDVIRELLAVVSQTDITELTIESGEEKITVKKSPPVVAPASTTTLVEMPVAASHHSQTPAPPQTQAQPLLKQVQLELGLDESEPSSTNGLVPIASPMVGTFYRSPSPSAPPFVDVGDRITVGQTICIIEAMKLMNDLPAEVAGRIVKVCAENGTTVEYGQALFMIDPNG